MEIICLGKGKAPGQQCLFCIRRNFLICGVSVAPD